MPKATILVVDDMEAVRKLICALLVQGGYECLEAEDAATALRVLEGPDGVHLVLSDVVMPGMSGKDLAVHLARTRPDVRVILMSGYVEDPMVRPLEASPAFLPKPFTPAILMDKVTRALQGPWESPV
jgi:two-component system, cell cycle sensor histidine kinase and response regulator CckA